MAVVVIIDDRMTNLKILKRFAETLGPDTNVRTYDNAVDALAGIQAESPDLIVTDYIMPAMRGDEFIRQCRRLDNAAEVPIIVVTAFEDREFRYQALNVGASDFLLSPVDGREFCTRARNLLTMWQQQKALRSRASSLESELADALRQHAEELRQRELMTRRIVNTVPALIRANTQHETITLLNSYHEEFFRLDPEAVIGHGDSTVFGSDYARRHEEMNERVLKTRQMLPGVEETLNDTDGSERVLLTTKAPLLSDDGKVDQIVTVSLDITERKRGEQAMRESEERFRNLVEGSLLGIVIEADGVPLFANRTFANIFGYERPEDILALGSMETLYPPEEFSRVRSICRTRSNALSTHDRYEFRGIRTDGTVIWVEIQVQAVTWKGQRACQSTVADITLRKSYEERLQRQANFDEITNLPNRILAFDRLRSAVISASRHNHKVGVLFIDLDHFKKINDTLGHATGDELLRHAAGRLTSCVRQEDTVARLGGDEFTVILPSIASASHTEPVIHKILDTFSMPFILNRQEAFVTATIGVTVYPDDGGDPHVLMRNADAAMYRAKEEGRNTFQFFTPELNRRAMERMRLESHLMHALDRDELSLHYQPIIDIRTGNVVGAEALLRWSNAELGNVPPAHFIPLAEDTGLIVPIGRWVIERACQQLRTWIDDGLPQLRVSVNISSRQFRGKDLVDALTAALNNNGISPPCLELEITEGLLMDELPQTRAAIAAIDGMAVRLALDDFGTGYSSLSYLKQFPVDTVKIDRSFIQDVSVDRSDATVVEAIIAMAHRMNLQVVAEGVETPEQLDFIRSRGCDLAQGYYFSRPLAADIFADWLAERLESARRAL